MALPPVVPSDTAAIVPQPGDPACTVLSNMVQGLTQWNAFISWLISEDGSITQDAIDAFGVGGTNALAAPTGVSASEDRTSDVTITWNAVSDASYYVVYRGTVGDTSTMTVLSGNLTERSYVDESATVDTTYWYSVRAYSSSRVSALSTPDRGIMVSTSTGTDSTILTLQNGAQQTFPVPASPAYATMELFVWASGGCGGRFNNGTWVPTGSTLNAGGGGGGGGFIHITGIPVTPGETFTVRIGQKTSPRPGSDISDGATFVVRDSDPTEYAQAYPGQDAADGNTSVGGAGGAARSAGAWGVNTLGGTLDTSGGADTSAIGGAGSAASGTTPGTGAAGITRSGLTAGAGGDGVQTATSVNPGGSGLVKITLRT